MQRKFMFLSFVLVFLSAFVWARSELELRRVYAISNDALTLSVSPGSELLDRGRHIATAVAQCQFCHGPDLAGREMASDLLLGQLSSTNLTGGIGGIGAVYTEADWVRALRFGVGQDGRSLVLMPSVYLSRMTDRDLAAVITYLKQVPAVDREMRSGLEAGVLTRFALGVGVADDLLSAVETLNRPRPQTQAGRDTVPADYLVDVGNCRICHHADLRGGLHPLALPEEPPPPDLRPGGAMEDWRLADFERAMRSGVTPDGRQLDREYMPWPAYAALTDHEIESLWNALSASPTNTSQAETLDTQAQLPSVSANPD